MLDIKFIREHTDAVKQAVRDKKLDVDIDALLAVDERRRALMTESERLRAEQKRTEDRARATQLKNAFRNLEHELTAIEREFTALMVRVPTIPAPDTPPGEDETQNLEVFRSGEIPAFDFKPKDHVELATALEIVDFERGAKVSGYRGYYLKNEGAELVMALMMFAFDKMVKRGYAAMIPPTIVKGFALSGSGYFKGVDFDPEVDEIYELASVDREASGEKSRDRKFLVGTAEPSLLAYYSDETLKRADLPIRLFGFSPCYRSEIGSYGKDTRGLYRVHEFMKVEQVIIAEADVAKSDVLQEEMVAITKEIHDDLGVPYRVIRMCAGDLGVGKYKQFDYEAWLPGSERWAETGSASNFLDWQARRLNIKYAEENGERRFAYLLNNTALPSPRPIIAILENYQRSDGSVRVPDALVPYMRGVTEIRR